MYHTVFAGGAVCYILKERVWFFSFPLNRIIEAEGPSRLVGIYSLARELYSRVGTWDLEGLNRSTSYEE